MKRFYKAVDVSAAERGFTVTLDSRPIRTPGKLAFVVPSRSLANAVAEEWRGQGETIDLPAMALTRFANTAIDRVVGQRAEVIRQVAAYGGTELVCYRANEPPELVERQSACWDPLLAWLAAAHGVRLATTIGVAPQPQADATLLALTAVVAAFDDFSLTALHLATAASGSVVIALALAAGRIDAGAAWSAALLDELYQAERWGDDAEARRRRDAIRADLHAAERFFAFFRQEDAA